MSKKNDPGVIWMPWIPIQTTQIISEKDIKPSIKSRYATKIVNSNFYGTFTGANWSTSFKNYMRKISIEKIFKIENPTE